MASFDRELTDEEVFGSAAPEMSDEDVFGKPVASPYDTRLAPDEEPKFAEWKQQNAPNDSGEDYDLRGAFKEGLGRDPATQHMDDRFKKPNHPTFSDESQYGRPPYAAAKDAGHWTGPMHDVYVPPGQPEPPAEPSTLHQIATSMPSAASIPAVASAPAIAKPVDAILQKASEGFGTGSFLPPPEEQKAFLDATAKGLESIGLAPKTPEEAKSLQDAIVSQLPKLATAAATTGVAAVNLMGRAFSAALSGGHEGAVQVFKGLGYSDNDAKTAADDLAGYAESVALRGGEGPFRASSARIGEVPREDAAGAFSGATAKAYSQPLAIEDMRGRAPEEARPPSLEPAAPREMSDAQVFEMSDADVFGEAPRADAAPSNEMAKSWLESIGLAPKTPEEAPSPVQTAADYSEPIPAPPVNTRGDRPAPPSPLDLRSLLNDKRSLAEIKAEREAAVKASEPAAGTREAPAPANDIEAMDNARSRVETAPSEAQKEAGNYQKGHADFHGMAFTMETAKGAVREGPIDKATGKPEWVNVHPDADYGYIKRTEAADGEQLDLYIGPNPNSKQVFVVDQYNPKTGKFDEHKAIGGTNSQEQAIAIYDRGFNDGSGPSRRGGVTQMPVRQFKQWAMKGDLTKPLVKITKVRQAAPLRADVESDLIHTIRAMGGIKVKDNKGDLTEEGQNVMAALKNFRRPGLINNKAGGLPPDQVLKTLREQRWFVDAPDQGADIQNLYDILGRAGQAEAGVKVHHPESEAARTQLQSHDEAADARGRADIEALAKKQGVDLSNPEIDAVIARMQDQGIDAGHAIDDHLERSAMVDMDSFAEEDPNERYNEIPFEGELAASDRQAGARGQEPEAQVAEPPQGGQARQEPEGVPANPQENVQAPAFAEEPSGLGGLDFKGRPLPQKIFPGGERMSEQEVARRKKLSDNERSKSELKVLQQQGKMRGKGLQQSGGGMFGEGPDPELKNQTDLLSQPPKEPPLFKTPGVSPTPSKLNLDVISGKAHADEVMQMELDAMKKAEERSAPARVAGGEAGRAPGALGRGRPAEIESKKAPAPQPESLSASVPNKNTQASSTPEPVGNESSRNYSFESFAQDEARLRQGDMTAAEAMTAFEKVIASEAQLKTELLTFPKDRLAKMNPRDRNETKQRLVDGLYSNFLNSFNASGVYSYSPFGGKGPTEGIRAAMAKQTDATIKEAAVKRKERAAEMVKTYTAPETLSQFEDFVRVRGRDKLSIEQRAKFDELKAEAGRADVARETERKAQVNPLRGTSETKDIIETKHTQKGHALFVVQLPARVEKDAYVSYNNAAKALGGYYSRYAQQGAVPGFQFKTREAAETFKSVLAGETSLAKAKQEAKTERAAEVKDNAVDRLRDMAANMTEKADESLGRDRLANTARRARMAAGAEADAAANKALATTMKNIADAIESGEAKNLGSVRTRADVETLDSLLRTAQHEWAQGQQKADPSLRYEKLRETPISREMVDKAVFPYPNGHIETVESLARAAENRPGTKMAARRILKQVAFEKREGEWRLRATNLGDMDDLRAIATAAKAAGKYEADAVLDSFKVYNRVVNMGLREPASLRAALREFLEYRGTRAKADPLKAAERALVGSKYEGYFPTPKPLAKRMVDEANIREGDSVLEPSAGKGDIADAVKAAHPNAKVSVIEPVQALRNVLEMKQHNIVGSDFLEHKEPADRIVMNPPFEKGQDVDHVRHAFELLNPGGRVVAIMGEHPFFASDKKSEDFRNWLDEVSGVSEKLPEGSFAKGDRPTGVNTRLVTIDKGGTPAPTAEPVKRPTGQSRMSQQDQERHFSAMLARGHKQDAPGDVALVNRKFVSFDEAVKALKAAVNDGLGISPFQFGDKLGIMPRDWDRLFEAISSPEQRTAEMDARASAGMAMLKRMLADETTGGIRPSAHDSRDKSEEPKFQPLFKQGEGKPPATKGETVRLTSNTTAIPVGKASEAEKAILDKIAALAQQIIPGATVHPMRSIEAGGAGGTHKGPVSGMIDGGRNVIYWALENTSDATGTLRHEALHWLRQYLTDEEWQTLVAAARRGNWMKKHDVDNRWPGLTYEEKMEEAIAEGLGHWRRFKDAPLPESVRSIFQRIAEFLAKVAKYLRERFGAKATANDIFSDIMSGKIGKEIKESAAGPVGEKFQAARRGNDFSRTSPSTMEYLSDKSLSLMERLKGGTSLPAISESIDRWRTGFQDRFLPLMRVQQAAARALNRPLEEIENPYLGEELSSGRKGAKIEDLTENMVRPLLMSMNRLGVSQAELETFLYARHAPERNARINEINPEFRGDLLQAGTPGSGMSDTEAAAIMAAVDASGRRPAFDTLAAMVDRIRDFGIDERINGGVLSQVEADVWRQVYKDYVPLRGKAELDPEAEAARPRTGGGFNVKGKESHRAFGRVSPARDILAYTVMQAEEAIIRAENNRVGQQFLNLARAAPNPDFWKIDKVTEKPVWNEAKQQVEYKASDRIAAEDADHTISVKEEGLEHRITLNRENPVASRLARAMRGLKDDQVGLVIKTLGTVNRWLSHVNTTLDPEFVINNAFRDAQAAAVNLQQFDMPGLTMGTLADYPKALKGAMLGTFKKQGGEWTNWYDEFRRAGGQVYFNQIEDIPALRAKLVRELKEANSGPSAGKAIRTTGRFIENVNKGVENAIRLSAYKNARERGMSESQAASLAKNLTVNFNRRGSWGPLMNAMYLFYNASMQGNATILGAMKNKRVRKVLGAIVLTGAALELLNVMLSDKDDDGKLYYDKITPFEKSRNLILMDPTSDKGRYFKIGLPYGYNSFYAMGRGAGELYRGKPVSEVGGNLLTTIIDAFNPIGGAASILSMISPTITDPIVDLAQNRDFTGRPIMPDQPQYGPKIPENQRYWGTASTASKAITSELNTLTGGDAVVPGMVDISPEVLDYMFGQVTGAAGTFYARNVDLMSKLFDPSAELSFNDIPMARRVVGNKPAWYDKSMLYQHLEEIEQAVAERKKYDQMGEKEKAKTYKPELTSLSGLPARKRRELANIRRARADIVLRKQKGTLSSSDYAVELKKNDASEKAAILDFNKLYNEKTHSAP